MLSQCDLYFIETLASVDQEDVASEAMSTDTYVVSPRATLRKMVEGMAAQRYESVVAMTKDDVVGILTIVDAIQALSQILFERKNPSD